MTNDRTSQKATDKEAQSVYRTVSADPIRVSPAGPDQYIESVTDGDHTYLYETGDAETAEGAWIQTDVITNPEDWR